MQKRNAHIVVRCSHETVFEQRCSSATYTAQDWWLLWDSICVSFNYGEVQEMCCCSSDRGIPWYVLNYLLRHWINVYLGAIFKIIFFNLHSPPTLYYVVKVFVWKLRIIFRRISSFLSNNWWQIFLLNLQYIILKIEEPRPSWNIALTLLVKFCEPWNIVSKNKFSVDCKRILIKYRTTWNLLHNSINNVRGIFHITNCQFWKIFLHNDTKFANK